MNKLLTFAASAAVTVATASCALASDVTLRMSNWLPTSFFTYSEVVVPWTEKVAEVTDGRVTVEILPKVVGSVPGQFDVIRDGLADVALVIPSYTPGRFPSAGFAELPLLPIDIRKSGVAMIEVYEKFIEPMNEFRGVEVLGIFPASPLHVQTKGVTVTSTDSMSGLKLRAASASQAETMKLIGATPIMKTAAEAFEMLSAGTIDGQSTMPAVVTGFNTTQFFDNTLVLEGGLGNVMNVFAANPAKWAKISSEDQAAIKDMSRQFFTVDVMNIYADQEEVALQQMKEAGYTITYASDDFLAGLRELAAPVTDAWVAQAKEGGLADPKAVLAKYLELGAPE